MLGKTHMMVGIASGLVLCQPQSIQELVLGTGVAAIGGVISDIDSGTSQSHKEADRILGMIVAAVVVEIIVEYIWHLGLYKKILQYSSSSRVVMASVAFLLICAWGKEQPHRAFMHSFLGLIALGACVDIFMPSMTAYFVVAFVSHLCIDFLNKKGLRLLYPIKKGFSLQLCSSKGLVNRLLFHVGYAMAIAVFVLRLYNML